MTLKIATWNLGCLSPSSARYPHMGEIFSRIQPHVFVLTEVHKDIELAGYRKVADSGLCAELKGKGYWATVWTKQGISIDQKASLNSKDTDRTAYARVTMDGYPALNIYATVLPWRGSLWKGIASAKGAAFTAALAAQATDWEFITSEHKDEWLCVAGDFNQTWKADSYYYGSKTQEIALEDTLKNAHLACLTGGPDDPVKRASGGAARNIDHICLGRGKSNDPIKAQVCAWEPKGVTDHYGVMAEVALS